MRLSDLTAYAKEKYNIEEQFKWDEFPNFSVLIDPGTQKWAALLMRQWNAERGEEAEYCDIKCGRSDLDSAGSALIRPPFRMSGPNWVGVMINDDTDTDTVCRLFDKAMNRDVVTGFTFVLGNVQSSEPPRYSETQITFDKPFTSLEKEVIPERIRGMMKLYEYGDGSFAQRNYNFYVQGKYMEDYEDDFEWKGVFRRYFTTYHDLRTDQLRGYFTWRTNVRHGRFMPVSVSLAYMYLYELINGIGTASPEDSIKKMKEFETGFIDHGMGDEIMRKNLRRWMIDIAVINGVSPDTVLQYMDDEYRVRDDALSVLRYPDKHDDEEIFASLCLFGGKKLKDSALIKKSGEEAKRLFAKVWKYISAEYDRNGTDFFRDCFGEQMEFTRRPLQNAVYYNRKYVSDAYYELNGCRSFVCRDGVWKERCYHSLSFDKNLFESFLRETDRMLRKYLKSGSPLKERPEDAWASRYSIDVIKLDEKEKMEAGRKRITIKFDDLDKIREDSLQTRDSLLTEEEKAEDTISDIPSKESCAEIAHEHAHKLLDPEQITILNELLKGRSVKERLRSKNIMAEIFADSLNEALFDEIGDTAVTCDGSDIYLVEDYREDIERIFRG